MQKQDLNKLQTRKMKGLKRSSAKEADKSASDEPKSKKTKSSDDWYYMCNKYLKWKIHICLNFYAPHIEGHKLQPYWSLGDRVY